MNSSRSAEKVDRIPGLYSFKPPIQLTLIQHFVITSSHKIILPLPCCPAEQPLGTSCTITVGAKVDIPQGDQCLWEPTSSVAPWSTASVDATGQVVSLRSADLPALVLLLQTKPTQRRMWGPSWGVPWEQGPQPELSSEWAESWVKPQDTGPSDQLDVRALAKHHGCLGNCYQISVYKYKILNLAWVLKLTSRQASPQQKHNNKQNEQSLFHLSHISY